MVASFGGGLVSLVYSFYQTSGKIDVLMSVNGVLGALVGITGTHNVILMVLRGHHSLNWETKNIIITYAYVIFKNNPKSGMCNCYGLGSIIDRNNWRIFGKHNRPFIGLATC